MPRVSCLSTYDCGGFQPIRALDLWGFGDPLVEFGMSGQLQYRVNPYLHPRSTLFYIRMHL